jgi:hypothetical protein
LRFRVGGAETNQNCTQTKDVTHEHESYMPAPTSEPFLLATVPMH